ncbi:MAG: hypothetical protein LBD48_08610 [Treponema sp.]|jgi:hypothetical protein|nr:hypothetical protein [Treponema sp.]
MSVRATDSLVAEVVVAADLAGSPKMIVQSVNAETKQVTTVWFSETNEYQLGVFPAGSLEKAVDNKKPVSKAKKPGKK